ncbi:MAG: PilZ domain-containing protein [Spirochaetales bacterium]|nr:PilZ domain-containing protein [Spirochaetales bacterium]
MAIITSQQINILFDTYKDTEITFNREVIRATGLVQKQIFLKFSGYQVPCIIYSVSMTSAKIVANLAPGVFEQIREAKNLVSLRFAFHEDDKANPLLFFVASRVTGYNTYNKDNPNLNFVNLEFTQRPADDLISILGLILEAKANSKKRSEDRIVITVDSLKKIGLSDKTGQLFIQSVPRNCIIRDLSFSGAKLILAGVAKFILNKKGVLHLTTTEKGVLKIPGTVIRNEDVEGRKDLAAIALKFEEDKVPIEYKLLINDYLKLKKN